MILSCTVLYNLQGGFLNGSGTSSGKYPVTEIKRFEYKGNQFPYMSVQSWKKLIRDTFAFLRDEPSYYDRLNGRGPNVLDPIIFLEDDIFGYSHPFRNPPEQDDPLRFRVASANRVAPLLLTNLVSLERNISTEKGFLHLEDDTPLPYSTQFSSGWFLGNMALDLDRIGTFRNWGDIVEMPEELLKKNKTKISEVAPGKFTVYNRVERVKDAVDILFDSIMGLTYPPKASQFLVDFSPKLLICTVSDGVAPFGPSLFFGEGSLGLDVQKFIALVSERGHTFKSPVFLGYRSGTPIIDTESLKKMQEEQTKLEPIKIMVTSLGLVKNELLGFLEGVL